MKFLKKIARKILKIEIATYEETIKLQEKSIDNKNTTIAIWRDSVDGWKKSFGSLFVIWVLNQTYEQLRDQGGNYIRVEIVKEMEASFETHELSTTDFEIINFNSSFEQKIDQLKRLNFSNEELRNKLRIVNVSYGQLEDNFDHYRGVKE